MGIHPNALMVLLLHPNDLPMKTYKEILAEHAGKDGDNSIRRGSLEFWHTALIEGGYDEDFQVSGEEGDIAVTNFITYGYGEKLPWADVVVMKEEMEEWARAVCEMHHCTYSIHISANYW